MSKKLFYIPIIYIILSLIVLMMGILHGSYDFSRLNSIYSNIFVYVTVFLYFIPIINEVKNNTPDSNFNNFCKVIYFVFAIQSFIILLSLMLPGFHKYITLFQSPLDAVRSISYGGVRGLALSGAQFFPLSALFAISQVFIIYFICNEKKFIHFPIFIMISIAGLTAGRTSLIGTLFSFLFLLIMLKNDNGVRQYFFKVIPFVLLSFLVLGSMYWNELSKTEIFDVFYNFAFEFLVNYQETGNLNTSSTDILSRMYWSMNIYDFVFGYGYYISEDGLTTFMNTDAGYMRNILFFGVFGTGYILLSTVLIFKLLLNELGDSLKRCIIKLFLILTLILHYKGDVLLHLVSVQSYLLLLYFMIFSSSCNIKKEV
ncbi:O-antigen polymerase [Aliivibrio fischeri]|uniref:O-antigen polymerase n=1 Tax=Aliivibrio fischeri TaxID=668 RepID=UPI001F321008|nr:O-antigen polymerase [Aliivibrio fischeri]MCE4935521.1 hypothetical protein [Aliivibrio fischeri]